MALAVNKQARHDYLILEVIEAGLSLSGPEVKAVRAGHVSLKAAYAVVTNGECWLLNAHISPYDQAGPQPGYEPTRSRKLLLHRRQIDRLVGQLKEKGLTLLPLKLYTRGVRIKCELGLGRGKKLHEKRELIKKRDTEREIRTALKRR